MASGLAVPTPDPSTRRTQPFRHQKALSWRVPPRFEQKAAKSAKKEQSSPCLVSFASFACFCSKSFPRAERLPVPSEGHTRAVKLSDDRQTRLVRKAPSLESPGRATGAKRRSPLGKIPALPAGAPNLTLKTTPIKPSSASPLSPKWHSQSPRGERRLSSHKPTSLPSVWNPKNHRNGALLQAGSRATRKRSRPSR